MPIIVHIDNLVQISNQLFERGKEFGLFDEDSFPTQGEVKLSPDQCTTLQTETDLDITELLEEVDELLTEVGELLPDFCAKTYFFSPHYSGNKEEKRAYYKEHYSRNSEPLDDKAFAKIEEQRSKWCLLQLLACIQTRKRDDLKRATFLGFEKGAARQKAEEDAFHYEEQDPPTPAEQLVSSAKKLAYATDNLFSELNKLRTCIQEKNLANIQHNFSAFYFSLKSTSDELAEVKNKYKTAEKNSGNAQAQPYADIPPKKKIGFWNKLSRNQKIALGTVLGMMACLAIVFTAGIASVGLGAAFSAMVFATTVTKTSIACGAALTAGCGAIGSAAFFARRYGFDEEEKSSLPAEHVEDSPPVKKPVIRQASDTADQADRVVTRAFLGGLHLSYQRRREERGRAEKALSLPSPAAKSASASPRC